MRYKKQFLILCAGAFFSLASLWFPYVKTVAGRGLFLTQDALTLLGVTFLASLLATYLLPDFFISGLKFAASSSEPKIVQPRTTLFQWGIIVFGLLSLSGLLYGVNRHILHSFLSSADEHSCYFLAECLRRGQLYVELPPLAEFFKVVHVGMRDGKWFSVYPLGWPLIWAIGLNLNIVDWLNPILSSLAVFFIYLSGFRLFGRWPTIFGLLVCVLSPFFMFTAASYFSHATSLLCISLFLYAFLRWRTDYDRGKDPIGWASLCGLGVGYGLITRPLTMFAVAGPFLFYHFWDIFFERRDGKFLPFALRKIHLRKSDWVFGALIAIFMLLMLGQNYAVTGKLFKTPLKHYQSWERLGFKKGHYTFTDGLFFLMARTFYLTDWLAPAFVASYLILLANLRRLRSFSSSPVDLSKLSLQTIFRLVPVFLAVAYFFYYSWGGNQWGPRYWWEGLPFLCVAVMDWLARLWIDRGLRVKKFILMLVVTSVASSMILFFKQAVFTEEASRQRRALYDLAAQTIQTPSLVLIRGFLGDRLVLADEDAIRNSPFLDGRILYARDLGDRNRELLRLYPHREFYRGTYDRIAKRPRLERINFSI